MNARQPLLEFPSHEVLSILARDDPQAYEAWRREVIENFIESAPAGIKPRLRGVQFHVDSVRQLSRSALEATVGICAMMCESFLHLRNGWLDLLPANEEDDRQQPASHHPPSHFPTHST